MTAAPSAILDGFGRPAIRDVRAHYEGAHSSPARSILPGVIQNARKDLSRATRRELLRNSRELYKNNPMVKAVCERLITYTVGTGIRPEPATSNPKWNERALYAFNEWAKNADLVSRKSFWELQAVNFRGMIVDGDAFIVPTHGDSGRPRVQLLEGHSITTNTYARPGALDDDGVIVNRYGRPIAYVVQEPNEKGEIVQRQIPESDIIQIANVERAGQRRGVCLAAAALTTAIDLHDILGLEKGAVKSAGSTKDIIKTENGELPDLNPIAASTRQKTSNGTTASVAQYYEEVFGGTSRVLRHGDSWENFESKRPSPAWQGFVDFLAELICLSYNLPPSLVRQMKVGGADTRRDLATMQRVCEGWQAVLAQQYQRVYEFVIEAEIEDGALAGAPFDWRATDWQFPRAPTVDAGRMSAQDREDVRTGIMTLREACGQYGVSPVAHVKQLDRELEMINPRLTREQRQDIITARLYAGPNGTGLPHLQPAATEPTETPETEPATP